MERKEIIKQIIDEHRGSLSLADFARDCGISRQVLHRWYHGISEPSLKFLKTINDTPVKSALIYRLYGGVA
jgi:transcriptional regulator with XRE-family HTH domain